MVRETAVAAALLGALALAFLATEASAGLTLDIVAPTEPIMPETGVGVVAITFTLDCQTALQYLGTVVLAVTPATTDPNLFVQGPGEVLLSDGTCRLGAAQVSSKADFVVSANRMARGLEPLPVRIEVRAPPPNAATSGPAASGNFTVTIDYFPYIQARVVETALQEAPGNPIQYRIQVSNFGNAATDVRFSLPDAPEGWSWDVPAPITLSSPNRDPARANATVVLEATGASEGVWTNKEATLTVEMTPHASADPAKAGDPIAVSLLPRVRGAPDAGALVLCAVAFALAGRRRA